MSNRFVSSALTLTALWGFVVLSGCSTDRKAAPADALVPPFLDTPVAPRPASGGATLALGKQLYEKNCIVGVPLGSSVCNRSERIRTLAHVCGFRVMCGCPNVVNGQKTGLSL